MVRKFYGKVFENPKIIEFPKRELEDRTFLKFLGIPPNAFVYSYLMHFVLKRGHLLI